MYTYTHTYTHVHCIHACVCNIHMHFLHVGYLRQQRSVRRRIGRDSRSPSFLVFMPPAGVEERRSRRCCFAPPRRRSLRRLRRDLTFNHSDPTLPSPGPVSPPPRVEGHVLGDLRQFAADSELLLLFSGKPLTMLSLLPLLKLLGRVHHLLLSDDRPRGREGLDRAAEGERQLSFRVTAAAAAADDSPQRGHRNPVQRPGGSGRVHSAQRITLRASPMSAFV